jgi:membrane protease YdiL (CAAX protease family)
MRAIAHFRRQQLRLLLVSVLWLAVLIGLLEYGARLLPTSLAQLLTGESYSTLAQLVAMAIGLGMSWLVLEAPRRDLGLEGIARGRGVLLTMLLAPAAYVAVCYVAVGLALPTLRQELAQGGVALVRSQGGAVVSAMTQTALFAPLMWAVVVSPLGEELLFRGALWGAVQGLFSRGSSDPRAKSAEDGLPLERNLVLDCLGWTVRSGSLATLLTTLVFATLHADLRGSQGIVRVASAAGLALLCGVARQSTGALAAPIVLHASINALSLASARRWVVSDAFPKYYTVPTLVSLVGGIGLVLAVGVMMVRSRKHRALGMDP